MATDKIHFSHVLFLAAAGSSKPERWEPQADVYRMKGGWLVEFELAGVLPDDVDLSVQGHALVVEGTRRDECPREGLGCHRLEIARNRFHRTLELPGVSEMAQVAASYRDGMLLVRIVTEGQP